LGHKFLNLITALPGHVDVNLLPVFRSDLYLFVKDVYEKVLYLYIQLRITSPLITNWRTHLHTRKPNKTEK